MSQGRQSFLAVISLLIILQACSSDNDPAGPPDTNPVETIGSAGGVVEGEGGLVNLNIPAGALGTEVAISIARATDTPSDPGMIGTSLYEFGPDGLEFATPVNLRINYDPADLPSGVNERDLQLCKALNAAWLPLSDSEVDTIAHTVTAELNGFSSYGPGDPVPLEQGIVITPDEVTLSFFEEQDFTLQLTGISSDDIIWSVLEFPFGGEIEQNGHFTGPGWQGEFHVIAALEGFPATADTTVIHMALGDFTCVNYGLIEYERGITFAEPGIGNGDLYMPMGIEWHNGFIWIADTERYVLRKFSDSGAYIGATGKWKHCWENGYGGYSWEYRIGWLSSAQGMIEGEMGCGIVNGAGGPEPGAFNDLSGLDFDPAGRIYVMDQKNNRIQVFDQSGGYQNHWGEEGEEPGTFNDSIVIAADDLFVYTMSGAWGVQKFSFSGELMWHREVWSQIQQMYISGIAVDDNGNIYIIDRIRHRLSVLSPQGDLLFTWGDQGDDMYGDDCMLCYPDDIELDDDGNIYILDVKGVAILSPTGNLLARVAESGRGIALDSAKNLYILAGFYEVHKWNRQGN